MVQDPYKVLGISPGASKEEIKRAYRKKTKECHPDIHPDDPTAEAKMAEVNEAYDMLMNPEKYAKRQQQQQQTEQNGEYGPESGHNGYSQGQRTGNNQGYGGWYGDFGGFDFGDIFGFGSGGNEQIPDPQPQPGDSSEVRRAIDAIRGRQYQTAVGILNAIVSSRRDGRWYYLSAVANSGAGNTIQALEQIRRAVQMEPENTQYQKLLQRFRQTTQAYQQAGRDYSGDMETVQKICLGLCMANFCCRFCWCGGI